LLDKTILTDLGRVLAFIPLAPKFSKMLLLSRKMDIIGYGLLLVSLLSVEEIIDKSRFREDFNLNDKLNMDDFGKISNINSGRGVRVHILRVSRTRNDQIKY